MAINVIRAIPPATRPIGFVATPTDGIRQNEGGQLVLRLDIPLPDFADPTKEVHFRIQQEVSPGVFQNVAGGGWKGQANITTRLADGTRVVNPADPTNQEHWSYIAVDLDSAHAFLRGSDIRATFDVLTPVEAGLVYERRTDPDKLP